MSNQAKGGVGRDGKEGPQQKAGQPKSVEQAKTPPTGGQQNEGEGNRTAAREYNADQHRFAEDPQKVKQAAQSAKQAVEGKEGAALERAEKEGAKHAKH